MKPARITVISDSFHTMSESVATLAASGHETHYVEDLVSWIDLVDSNRAALETAEAVVMGRVLGIDTEHFSLAPNLKIIALHTSGSDNIDIAEATRRGVLVTNVKGVNAEQCAEFAMGLMLSVVRQIRTGDRAIRAGLWASHTQTSLDVFGSTLGIIGCGEIARAFIRRARSFGVRILVHTRTEDPRLAGELGFTYAPLDQVLQQSDIVSLFASLNNETRHLIGKRELALMRPSSYLINIARGELIDEQALFETLSNNRIAGAGLDVFEGEPVYNSPFFSLDNLVLTPHQAGLTVGGKVGAAVRAARNAIEALAGSIPADTINPQAWTERQS